MSFPCPERIAFDSERRVSVLTFPAVGHSYPSSVLPDGEWVMRGAVSWPVYEAQAVGGVALLCGMSVALGHWLVFREQAFMVIDPVLGQKPDGGGARAIVHEGLGGWLNKAWSAWYCTQWYWSQAEDVARPFRLAVIRSESIKPQPVFVEVVGFDRAAASMQMVELIGKGRLRFVRDGLVAQGLAQWQSSGGGSKVGAPAAVHALMCLVAGVGRAPWRDQSE